MLKLSVITAIHNGLSMNRLFWKALSENTSTPFELIIIDNHSSDGSEIFFKQLSDNFRQTEK
jgi:GT2 family glycosyltransferase